MNKNRVLKPDEVKYVVRKLRSLDRPVDPALARNKTKKGAKHGVSKPWKPNYAGTLRPAVYRALHKGKQQKGGKA